MSNYLERVAASAGRKSTGARPPGSGPPLLPISVGLSATSQELWQSDEPFFTETITGQPVVAEPALPSESSVPSRTSARAEAADPHTRSSGTPPRPQLSSSVSLKNESQLTVHLPKTLLPVVVDQIAHPGSSEHASDAHPPPVGTASTPLVPGDRSGPGFQYPKPAERAASPATKTTVPLVKPTAAKVSASENLVASTPRPAKEMERETALPNAPGDLAVSRVEPLQPASAILPPVLVAGANRKPEARVSIGHLEVIVNNHPAPEPVQQRGSPPLRSEAANLERRYLDRFRLRP